MKRYLIVLMAALSVLFACDKLDQLGKDAKQDQETESGQQQEGGDQQGQEGGEQQSQEGGDQQGQEPEVGKYVATVSITYVENVNTDASIGSRSASLRYDNLNRVSAITSNGNTTQFDYSQTGKIVVTTADGRAYEAPLGQDGLVDRISMGESSSLSLQRTGSFIDKVTSTYQRDGEEVSGSNQYLRTDNKLTAITIEDGTRYELPAYRFNFKHPNINIDLNWANYSMVTDDGPLALMWLGMGGKLADYLVEIPLFSYKASMSVPAPGGQEPGTYHKEFTIGRLGNVSDMHVENDADGFPLSITYDWDVDEYKVSYDYEVYENGGWNLISGNEDPVKTGKKLGTNNVILAVTYK